ncbi:Mediator of RNA polymerase II transcription subunit 1, partial [Paramuricea clavata]
KFIQNSKAYMDCLIIKKWLKERNMEYSAQMAYRQKLPEEKHIYRISEKDLQGSLSLNSNVGVVISRIPFTHCQNVVKIIRLLRQQLVYNQILTSVLSSQTIQDSGLEEYDGPCFDVSTSNPFVVVITFEESITSSLASVEFQVKPDCNIGVKFNPRKTAFYDSGYVSRVIQKCLSIPVTMKYIFKKARKMQSNNETPMVVDVDETDSTFIQTPDMHSRQVLPQSSAYNLLASMIARPDTLPILPSTNPGLVLPLLSPSPTLPNMLQTPSPSASSFPFVFQPSQGKENEQFLEDNNSVPSKEMEQQPQPPPVKPPPIRMKIKKVASNYIIETPKDIKLEPSPVIDNTPVATQFDVPFDTGGFTAQTSDMLSTVPFQQSSNVDQLISSAPGDQPMDVLHPVSFIDVEHTAFLPSAVNTGVSGPSRVTDVEGIFQTLPGGATSSPGGLDVVDSYEFDAGLDPTFDIEAEIVAAGVGSVTSDGTGFDISSVYEPGASTSSSSAMTGTFDLDSTFDLETLVSGSQTGEGSSLEWGLGNNGGSDS